jgi:thiol-disulfide isomerase/thioredoxin
MKRLFLILLSFTYLLFGYQKGDMVDANIVKELNLQKEKVYIIDFFASWCHSCKMEMPHISKLNKKIDKNRVEIIGIDVDEEIKDAKKFQEALKKEGNLNFRVINDPKGKIVSKFNPIGTPAIYIIKDLKVVALEIGAKDEIDKIILKHLESLK